MFPQTLRVVRHIFRLYGLALLHHGADNIGLVACRHFLSYEAVRFLPEAGIHHTVFYGETAGGKFINDGNIQIPV